MKKKWICLLTALVVTAGACMIRPVISGAAPELEREDCSLTVYPEDPRKPEADRYAADMEKAGLVVSLYRVAEAIKTPGYDTYHYEFLEPYQTLSAGKDITTEGWKELAEEAARIAVVEEKGIETAHASIMEAGRNSFQMLDTGLYLMVAHGNSNLKDEAGNPIYWKELKIGEGEDEETNLVTIANSDRYTYLFTPQLFSIPMRGNGDGSGTLNVWETDENGTPLYMTSDRGPWVYNLNVYLKPDREDRYGSLQIIKTLSQYETEAGIAKPEPTTFVFEITATLDGETVFHTFESISFTAGGTESVTIDHIPATADVTVTEVYTGSSYEISGPAVRDGITITADDVADAPFTNVYNGDRKKGYGIKNQFDFNGDTWVHSPVTPDDEQDRPSLRPGTGTPTQPGGEENPDGEQNGPGEGEQVPPVGQGTETPGQNMTTQPEGQPIE